MVADAPLGEALPCPGEALGVPPLPREGEGGRDTLGEELREPLAVGDAELQALVVAHGDGLPLPAALLLWAGEIEGRAGEALPRRVRVPAALVPEAAGLSVMGADVVARGESVPSKVEGEGGTVTVPPRWCTPTPPLELPDGEPEAQAVVLELPLALTLPLALPPAALLPVAEPVEPALPLPPPPALALAAPIKLPVASTVREGRPVRVKMWEGEVVRLGRAGEALPPPGRPALTLGLGDEEKAGEELRVAPCAKEAVARAAGGEGEGLGEVLPACCESVLEREAAAVAVRLR